MSQNGFILRSVLYGLFLGVAIVTGWLFSPHILALFHPSVPEVADRLTAAEDKVKVVKILVPNETDETLPTGFPGKNEERNHLFTGAVPAVDVKGLTPAEQGAQKEGPLVKKTTEAIKPYYAGEESLWKELAGKRLDLDQVKGYPYGECFEKAASRNDLPLPIILGMANYLSNFETRSSMDDKAGIMHLRWPIPAKGLGVNKKEDLFQNPCQNIMFGCNFLSGLLSKSRGEWVPALVAYRDQVEMVHPEKIKETDLLFCAKLRKRVKEVLEMPFEQKTLYPFWKFDERTTAQNFLVNIERRSGVDLMLGQDGYRYVVYIPAANKEKKREKAGLIKRETGIVELEGTKL